MKEMQEEKGNIKIWWKVKPPQKSEKGGPLVTARNREGNARAGKSFRGSYVYRYHFLYYYYHS